MAVVGDRVVTSHYQSVNCTNILWQQLDINQFEGFLKTTKIRLEIPTMNHYCNFVCSDV